MNCLTGNLDGILRSFKEAPDLSPHEGYPVEWWFLHGYFEGTKANRKHFMVALFRAADPCHRAESGTMLLLVTLDPVTGANNHHSRISPEIVTNYREMARIFSETRFSSLITPYLLGRHLRKALRDINTGLLHLDRRSPHLAGDPLVFRWGEFAMQQNKDTLDVAFSLPDSGAECAFNLKPQAPWMNEADIKLSDNTPIGYAVCPRMELKGHAGGEAVTGRAWMDHQWGGYFGLLIGGKGERHHPLGWDWFGINLDDGTDLLVQVVRHVNKPQPLQRNAYIFNNGFITRLNDNVDLHPLEYWRSPRTAQRYPVGWRIEIPGAEMKLEFSPHAEDQEIPVFGLKSIWEGAGKVTGTNNGRQVNGDGRLELHGYGFDLNMQDATASWFKRQLFGKKPFVAP